MTQQATISEAARRLGVSPDTVRRYIRQGKLAAAKQPSPRGLVWLVDLPDDVPGLGPDAASEVERLREDVGHWRELSMSLRQELAARTQEIRQLLVLLERSQDRLPATSGALWGQDGGMDGRRVRDPGADRAP
jgi:transposase-like protein